MTSKMQDYRKKPVVIQAAQWFPGRNDDLVISIGMINQGDKETVVHTGQGRVTVPAGHGLIPTLEGAHIVTPGDWIIKGVAGEYYPCKPEIFEKTYEKA